MFTIIVAIICLLAAIVLLALRQKLMAMVPVVVAVIAIIMGCTVFMETGYTGILTTFGKVEDRTLEAGLNWIKPWQDVVKMNNQKQRQEFALEAFSGDIQQVTVAGSFNHSIDPATAMNLYREVGTKYMDTLVNPRLLECTKAVFSAYSAEELISQRNQLSIEITEMMQAELEGYGVNIIDVVIEDIDFTDAFTSAVEAKQVATQEKLKAQTQQEQLTMEAEAEAKRKQIAAESEAEILKIKADAAAYETTTRANAEAEANKKIAESLDESLIQYTYANIWDGKLPTTYMGSDDVFSVVQADPIVGE